MARIAIAGFQHETNCHAPRPTGFEAFRMADSWPGLLQGDAVVSGTRGMNLPIAGFADAAARAGDKIVPILWCAAEPGGRVEDAAFERIAGMILGGIAEAGDIDAIYLDLHGAMITQSHADGEAALLSRIRAEVGHDLPVAVSLDLHANISPKLLDLADVICIYRTYPHLDMAETGARARARLARIMGEGRFAKAFRQAAFEVPLSAQHTDGPPCNALYAALPDGPGVLVEMALGFSAGDTPDRKPSVLAYAQDQDEADRLADAALARLSGAETEFDRRLYAPDEAVALALDHGGGGPVVLADVQDNPGAGASSDTTGLLRALVRAGAEGVLMGLMCDAALAEAAHRAGVGAQVEGAMGGRSGLADDAPFEGRFRVEHLSDGQVRYTGRMYGGGIGTLGPSCVLSLGDGAIRIVVTSIRNQCLDLAHFTAFGLDPAAARIICVKSTAHFRADFAPIAGRIILVAAPGLFPCEDFGKLAFV